MVNEVLTVENCCGGLYGAASTREGWRRRNERSNGMLAFISIKWVALFELGKFVSLVGRVVVAIIDGNCHGGLNC